MPPSFVDNLTLTCPKCGRPFAAELWLIVDVAARPDLLARVREGTIHHVVCPDDHTVAVDAPLLLYRPGDTLPLLFSPSAQTTADQDRAIAGDLLRRLAQGLGTAWRDEWVAGLAPLPRHQLTAVLDGQTPPTASAEDEGVPPAVVAALMEVVAALAAEGVRVNTPDDLDRALVARPALRERLEAAARAAGAPAAQRPADEASAPRPPAASPVAHTDTLLATLRRFVEAETWLDSYRFVRLHPELLTDAAEAALARYAERAAAVEDEAVAALFAEHLALLRRAREAGVVAAFAEKLGVTAGELEKAPWPHSIG